MKYRTRQEKIEAIQFIRKNWDEVVKFTNENVIYRGNKVPDYCLLETNEGTVLVREYDYIVKYFNSFYPVERNKFESKYESYKTK